MNTIMGKAEQLEDIEVQQFIFSKELTSKEETIFLSLSLTPFHIRTLSLTPSLSHCLPFFHGFLKFLYRKGKGGR